MNFIKIVNYFIKLVLLFYFKKFNFLYLFKSIFFKKKLNILIVA